MGVMKWECTLVGTVCFDIDEIGVPLQAWTTKWFILGRLEIFGKG